MDFLDKRIQKKIESQDNQTSAPSFNEMPSMSSKARSELALQIFRRW